jgi:iron complex outermembrane receptor protein
MSPLVPIDANQNPGGAFLNQRAGAFLLGFDRPAGEGIWTTTASVSRTRQDILRGYLLTIDNVPGNARGLREQIDLTDIYADSHVAWHFGETASIVAGVDFLHGMGKAHGADFDCTASLDGSAVPQANVPTTLDVTIEDRRDFFGGYAMAEWTPTAAVRIDAGLRLNATNEGRDALSGAAADTGAENTKTNVRPGGNLGVMWTAWHRDGNRFALFADYRNTFKPAAFDFGIGEGEGGEGILKPETSQSVEVGMKSRWLHGRVSAEASYFLMDFANLVVGKTVNGLPALTNAGTERFTGVETALAWYLPYHLTGRATYSFHDARFRDYVAEFDGVPTELGGNRIEMSARHLAAIGLFYAPERGATVGVEWSYVGSRYLNMRNTALADGFGTLGAAVGYRSGRWELRVDGRNLTNQRPPVSESEFGDAQYYRLPARRIDATLSMRF